MLQAIFMLRQEKRETKMNEVISPETVYLEYRDKVTRYVSGKVRKREDVEDIVSLIFTKVCDKFSCFDRSKASVSTWIYTITRNTVTDWMRIRKPFCELSENIYNADNIDAGILKEEALEELAKQLEKLRDREREVIVLHYYGGYTLKAISEKLGMSYISVKVMHKSVLSKLKRAFDWQ